MKQNLNNTKTLLNPPSIVRALLLMHWANQPCSNLAGAFKFPGSFKYELHPKKKIFFPQKASCIDLRISFRFKLKAQKGFPAILSSMCYFNILLPQ